MSILQKLHINSGFYSKKESFIFVILFTLVWVELFLKSIYTGVFHDELTTFYFHTQTGQIFSENAHFDANNHFLNSVLSHWSFKLFGGSPLAMRLPNLLFFPIYIYALFRLSSVIKQGFLRWSLVLTLGMCGFILEYFCMSRGYGMAIALLLLGIWYLFRFMETKKVFWIIAMAAALWLANFANLTMLVSSLLIYSFAFGFLLFYQFGTNKKSFFINAGTLALSGIPFLYHANWSMKMKDADKLVYGSLDGIYDTTINSISLHVFGLFNQPIGIGVIIVFWLIFVGFAFNIIKGKQLKEIFKKEYVFSFLILSSVLMVFIMGRYFEINYPMDRTGMNLFVFLVIGSIFALSKIGAKFGWTQFAAVVLLIIPLRFMTQLDPNESQNWKDWRHSQRIYELVDSYDSNFKFPVVISAYMRQDLPWYYASYINGGTQGGAFPASFPSFEADVIIKGPQDNNWLTPSIYNHFDSVYCDPYTEVTLFKRKQFLEKELIYTYEFDDVENRQDEYFNLMEIGCDTLKGEALYVGVEMTLDADCKPFRSRLVGTVDQSEPLTNLYYDFVQLDWLKKEYSGEENNVVQGTLISTVPENGDMLTFYLWNPDMTPFSIRNGKCYLYRLKRDF